MPSLCSSRSGALFDGGILHCRRFAVALFTAAIFTALLPLHAVQPLLNFTEPPGAQRGTEIVVTLNGDRLQDAEEVFFYERGIECLGLEQATNKSVRATFRIAPDCRVGEHNLRVRTRSGISPLRIFYVGLLPNATEKEPNNAADKAQAVSLNTTVNGRVDSEDEDHFTVELAAGQRLSVEVEGARLGRTMFDAFLCVRDASGRKLAQADDTALLAQDAFVSLLAPEAGRYTIELRDGSYSGSGHVYRLHVGDFPRPHGLFPLGGEIGQKREFAVLSDVGEPVKREVQLPLEPAEKFPVLVDHNGLPPSPNWLRASPFSDVTEVEPNNALSNATLAAFAPVAFNGILSKAGDVDYFKFPGTKGESVIVQAWARRMGSPVDTVVQLLNAKGGSVASNDDSGGNPDSLLTARLPEDGEYFIKVSDQLGRGGPFHAYRIEVTKPRPNLALSVPDTARYDYETRKSIVVPQGNRFALLMNVGRNDYSGAVDLSFPGLPAGIGFAADTVSNGVPSQLVVFEADEAAAVAGRLLTPEARPLEKADAIPSSFRHRVEWVRIQNNTVYTQSDVGQIAAAVAEKVPYQIRVTEPKVPIVQDGLHELEVIAERAEGFDGSILVQMAWNPPGMSSISSVTIPKGTNRVTYRINADGKAQTRTWRTALTASSSVNGGTAHVSSQLFKVEVAPAFVTGRMELTAIERGRPGKMICKLDQKVPFEGTARVELIGLPTHVTSKPVEITKDSTEAVFELASTEKAQPGLTKGLYCKLVITRDGEPITHSIARGGILRVDAPKALASASAAPKP